MYAVVGAEYNAKLNKPHINDKWESIVCRFFFFPDTTLKNPTQQTYGHDDLEYQSYRGLP